jgi:predicted outer membrane repeat protein
MYMDSCTFYGNTSDGQNGGAIYCDQSIVEIDHTVFSCNTVSYSATNSQGGGAIYAEDCEINIRNCTFDRNAALYNGNGGAIMGIDCVEYDIVNCIVHNNNAADDGGGVYSITNQPDITHSDFYNNTNGNCSGVVPAGFEVLSQENYNGDSCDTYYNIFMNPEFEDTASLNYHLLGSSPCIDAGDPTSPLDPDATIADMGAFYFDQTGVAESDQTLTSNNLLLSCLPNPSRGHALLTYTTLKPGNVNISIFDATGRLVSKVIDNVQQAGTHSLTLDNRNLGAGIYFVSVETADSQDTRLMTIIE